MNQVFVLGGLRSYIGVENGTYAHISAEQLGAAVLKELMNRYSIEQIDCIIGGNSIGGGSNLTRLMALEAGISPTVPAFSIDTQCASSLEAIISGSTRIESGLADVVIAGGFESTSTQPQRSYNKNHPDYKNDLPYRTAKFIPNFHEETIMLQCANAVISSAGISRKELDLWALESHKRAIWANDHGYLDDITCSIFGLNHDESIRKKISLALLNRLPGLLSQKTNLTAGNTCPTNDGAAFIILCSEQYLQKKGVLPKHRILDACFTGVDPFMSPIAAVESIKQLLRRNNYSIDQIHAIESNEAFSAIDVLFEQAYPNKWKDYNRFGGALAYGHPYGASGAIIFLHLMKSLDYSNGQLGVCSIAAAGGLGTSILLERL